MDYFQRGLYAFLHRGNEEEEESIDAEEIHEKDANEAVFLNVILIACVLLTYYIKKNRVYFLPESAAAMLAGIIVGGVIRLTKGEGEGELITFQFVSLCTFFLLHCRSCFSFLTLKVHRIQNFSSLFCCRP